MAKSSSQHRGNVPRAVALALLLSAVHATAWSGGEPGAYLRLPAGAAAMALGGANTAAPEYLAAWWNPAMLAVYRQRQAAAGMGVRSLGRMEGLVDYSFRVPTRFGLGISALYRGDPFLNDLRDEQGDPLEHGSYTSLTFKAGVGVRISRAWSAGLSMGVFYQSLPSDFTANGTLLRTSVTGIGGFTLSARYERSERLCFALLLRNLGLDMDWAFVTEDNGYEYTYANRKDSPPPEFVLASRFQATLLGRPLTWTSDVSGYLFDGEANAYEHPRGTWNNGLAWQSWETFQLRLGIGELPLAGSFINDSRHYWETFTLRVALGFCWDASMIRRGLTLQYAISTDKAGALFDQALDVTLAF